MRFLTPGALWALLGILVLVLLSLWRLRPRRRLFPHVGLWEKLPDRRPPIRSLERPRLSPLLLLQILLLVSVVLAWSRPSLVGSAPAGRRVAFVFDTSASMMGRMERVRVRARELLEKLAPADKVALYAMLPEPWIYRGDPLEGLSRVKALRREMDVRQILKAVEEKEVYVFTDEELEGVRVVGTGKRVNGGIIDLRREGEGLFVRLGFTGSSSGRKLLVERDGAVVEKRELTGTETGLLLPKGDRVRLDPADEFPLDDVAVVPPEDSFQVVLHGDPDPELRRALRAVPGLVLAERGGIHLYYRTVPRALGAGTVVIQPPNGFAGIRLLDGIITRPKQVDLAPSHPLVASLDGEGIRLDSCRGIDPEDGKNWAKVLTVSDVPIVVAGSEGQVVVSAEWRSDGWPLHPSFPIFWTNVLRFATTPGAGRGFGLRSEALRSERETLASGVEESEIVPGPVTGTRPLDFLLDGFLIAIALLLLPAVWLLSRE